VVHQGSVQEKVPISLVNSWACAERRRVSHQDRVRGVPVLALRQQVRRQRRPTQLIVGLERALLDRVLAATLRRLRPLPPQKMAAVCSISCMACSIVRDGRMRTLFH
jgi:hypothetical protein